MPESGPDRAAAAGRDRAERSGGTATGPVEGGGELTGPALARAALDAALARQRANRTAGRPAGGADRTPGNGEVDRRNGRRLRGYSGPGPDPRDPQPLGAVLDRLVRARGWQRPAAEAAVFGNWTQLVGADIAAHCRPVKLENGELTVEAESTAWATQLRLLTSRLLGRIAGEVGDRTVTRLHIRGPAAPSWDRGRLRVRGRGPRDTYG